MEVEFNPGLNVNIGTGQPVARPTNPQPSDNTMSIGRTQDLEKTLQETPQIRPEAVARASALASDENYPSDELLNKMAGFLAGKITDQPD